MGLGGGAGANVNDGVKLEGGVSAGGWGGGQCIGGGGGDAAAVEGAVGGAAEEGKGGGRLQVEGCRTTKTTHGRLPAAAAVCVPNVFLMCS